MSQTVRSTESLWELPNSQVGHPLAGNISCDACVVGAGIAGLTTAYLLCREGKRVVVLDSKPQVVRGESRVTTAHLSWVLDDRFEHVEAVRGAEGAKDAAASHRGAIDLIEEIATREQIACDFHRVPGYLFSGRDGTNAIDGEEKALRRLGLPFERVDRVPFASGPAMRFSDQGQFHPVKYLTGLTERIERLGGTIHTDTQVVEVRGGSPCEVATKSGHRVSCRSVVIATNNPFEAGTTLHTKVAAYLTYAIAAELPRGTLPLALYWDTEDPYHYVRLQPGEASDSFDYLIVGGEDHKTGQAEDTDQRWGRLTTWMKERFPNVGVVRHRWSGQVFETPDGLGLIGMAPGNGDNVFIITGDSGMGMTHGTLGARLVADLVQQRSNPYAGLYSPSRWMPAAARTLLGEVLNMASQYTDWLTGGDVGSADDIPRGHGAIVRSGLTKLALYKNDAGQVTRLSAVCPHMGCIVRWNPGERTWDCPCHGSRFSCEGKVSHGPATANLKAAEPTP